MSAISAFISPFANSGDLGVGIASILGGDATSTSNAASVLQNLAPSTGPFAAIAASLNTVSSPTVAALETGALTGSQHNVIQTISAANNQPTSIPWTSSGNEPSVVAQMRSYGWIKLIKPTADPSNPKQVDSATYELTPVGLAIAKRTGGGQVGTTA